MDAFCASLKALTGCHVGLVAEAIHCLNELIFSHVKSANPTPTAQMLISQLRDESLLQRLRNTRCTQPLNHLQSHQLETLERIFCGEKVGRDSPGEFIKMGILLEFGIRFSSDTKQVCGNAWWRIDASQVSSVNTPRTGVSLT